MRKTLAAEPMPAGGVARPQAVRHMALVGLEVAVGEDVAHAERTHGLGVAPAQLGDGVALVAALGHVLDGRAAAGLGQQGEDHDHHAAADGEAAEPGVEEEAAREEERHERHVEQRGRPEPGEEVPDLVEVADRLQAAHGARALEGQDRHELEDPAGEQLVEAGADAGEHLGADRVSEPCSR
jgi:hypothetical protein